MFRYRFACTNKDDILFRINQFVINDSPRKTIFGCFSYAEGIHFRECGNKIKGFYLDESEETDYRKGTPIRVCFSGKFVEKAGKLFFDVYIYPNIFEALLLTVVFGFACIYGGIGGSIAAALVSFFFIKGYYEMIQDTRRILGEMFR